MLPEALEDLRIRWERERTPQLALELTLGCRECGDHAAVVEVLEAVVAEDPTQLEANKLLVEVYTRLGEVRKATDRLDLYALLSDDEEEVEALRAVVDEGVAAAPSPPAGEPFDLGPLWEGVPAETYHQALAAEGIFERTGAGAEGDEATATLGELFMEQGHASEAERIFREVLEREPDNAAALAGLERLSAGAAQAPAAAQPAGTLAERKASVLKDYLEKLMKSQAADV